jgi:hypothetical protein
MHDEIWAPVPTLRGQFEVSNRGGLRRDGQPVTPSENRGGYLQVTVSVFGTPRTVGVHRLVADAFIGPCPAGHDVDHINGDRKDNRLSNLRYLTRQDNVRAARRLNLIGGKAPRAKLGRKQITVIGTSKRTGEQVTLTGWEEIIEAGFMPSGVSQCLHGKIRSHGGFTWERADAQG